MAARPCPFCDAPPASHTADCAQCRSTVEWIEQVHALDFALRWFQIWQRNRVITDEQAAQIDQDLKRRREAICQASVDRTAPPPQKLHDLTMCWGCKAAVEPDAKHCRQCGAPTYAHSNGVRMLTQFFGLGREIQHYERQGMLLLNQAHACLQETKERIGKLRLALEDDRVKVERRPWSGSRAAVNDPVAATTASPAATPPPQVQKRSFLEIVLDPRSLQGLLICGGLLLVVGLVIWLATLGVFENAYVVAVCLGAANLAALAAGVATIRFTRYQLAGRSLTLLACLIMPLNLWFYHSYDLITLDGHLWVPALLICLLYAGAAVLLSDALFVYVFYSGIALTGLLMLADMGKFMEIAAPSALLVVLGMIAIHAERAFLPSEEAGPFSRRKFGLASFWSGHVMLAAGLLLLLGAQVAGGWLYEPLFRSYYQAFDAGRPAIVATVGGQWTALVLVLCGIYAYVYSDLVVRQRGVYLYAAVGLLLWAEVLAIELLDLNLGLEIVIAALALTGLVANVLKSQLSAKAPAFSRVGPPLALFLSITPAVLGLALHLRATYETLNLAWPTADGNSYVIGWSYVAAMLLTAIGCRVGAYVYRHDGLRTAATYFVGTGAATLCGAAGLLHTLGIHSWAAQAPILMLIPIAYVIAARLYRDHVSAKPLTWVAQAAGGIMLAAVVQAALRLTPQHVFEPETGKTLNLLLAAFFAEAAWFYVLTTALSRRSYAVYLATAAGCGAVWQLLSYQAVPPQYYTLLFAGLGLALMIGYRLGKWRSPAHSLAAFQAANALMSVSFLSGALQTLGRLFSGSIGAQHDWLVVWLLAALGTMSFLAGILVRNAAWRSWYTVLVVVDAALLFMAVHVLANWTPWQKVEIFSVAVGVALLTAGHIGWFREQRLERQSDQVSFCLFLGNVLVGLPLAIALYYYRSQFRPGSFTFAHGLNEMALLGAAILLLVSGILARLKSTTIAGAAMLAFDLLTLFTFVHIPEKLQTVGMALTAAGGTLFVAALLLSIYRDNLMALPDAVKRREGVFRVLTWR